nr:MAG TPA: hypothetical protein [Caudoviricetes sp.]
MIIRCKCHMICITTKQHYKQITAKGKYNLLSF